MLPRLLAVGGSSGSVLAFQELLRHVSADCAATIVVALHRHPRQAENLTALLATETPLRVRVAEDKDRLQPGSIFVAPADYHLLVNRDETLSLSIDPPVNFSRPSIDVLFRSAADAYAARCIAVLLSGSNEDGAEGLAWVRSRGGLVVCQSPESALHSRMPEAGIREGRPDLVARPRQIGRFVARAMSGDH